LIILVAFLTYQKNLIIKLLIAISFIKAKLI